MFLPAFRFPRAVAGMLVVAAMLLPGSPAVGADGTATNTNTVAGASAEAPTPAAEVSPVVPGPAADTTAPLSAGAESGSPTNLTAATESPAAPAVAATGGATNVTAAVETVVPVPSATAGVSTNAVPATEGTIRFEFSDMPYRDVVQRFSQITGKPLISDVQLEGTLTFSDPQPYTYGEALDTLNLILAGKKAMLVETGRYLRLIPFDDLQKLPLPIFEGVEKADGVRPGEVVTVVLQLQNLDASEISESITGMLTKAGSVAPLSRGRGLIVTDRVENIRRVRELLAQIDASAPKQRQMKIHPLKNASGTLLADLVNRTFGVATAPKKTVFNQQRKSWDVLPADPEDYITAIFAEASNTLVLFGPAERMSMAEELITRFETESGARASEVKVFYPQMNAEDLGDMVREAIPGIASPRDNSKDAGVKARVIADSTSNRLIVTAPASGQLDSIEKLIHQLDPTTQEVPQEQAGEKRELRIVQLQTVSSSALAPILRDAFAEQLRNEKGADFTSRARILPDPSGGRLLLSGSPEELDQIATLIQQLDAGEEGQSEIKVFKLKVANARNVSAMIMGAMGGDTSRYQYRRSGGLQRPGGIPARAIADDRSNSLIVMASPEQMKLIEEVIQKIEEGGDTEGREVKLVKLEHNSATSVAAMLSQLYYAQIRGYDREKRIAVTAAPDDRTIALEADGESMKQLLEVVKELDVEPADSGFEVRTYAVPEGRVNDIISTLTRLYSAQRDSRGRDRGPEARFEADAASDTLIVAAKADQFPEIEALLEKLRTAVSSATQMRTFLLKHARADQVVNVLQSMLGDGGGGSRDWYYYQRNRGGGSGGNEFKVTSAPALNAIVMQAAPQKLALATQLIQTLDVPETSAAATVQTVALKRANADEVAAALSRMLSPRDYREAGSGVRVAAVSGSKTLLVSGPEAEVKRVVGLINELDSTAGESGQVTRVYRLQHADTDEVIQVLQSALDAVSSGGRSYYYGYRYGGGQGDTIKVSPADSLKAIVVQASTEKQQQVADLIALLDVEDAEGASVLRTVQLKQANADELAQAVTQILSPYDWRGDPPAVRVTPVSASKTLLVKGPQAEVERVVTLIEQLDATSGTAGQVTRVYHLQHAKSEEVIEVLQSALDAVTSSSRSYYYGYRSRGGGQSVDTVKVSAARELNAVVVQAMPEKQTQAEELIKLLDVEDAKGSDVLRTVQLKQANADELAQAVTQILSPYDWRGEPPAVRVTPVSASKTLLVKGPETEVERVVTLIEQLDATSGTAGQITKVYHLQHADAQEVVSVLETTLGGTGGSGRSYYYSYRYRGGGGTGGDVRVTAAEGLNSVVVQATPEKQKEAEALIKLLDVEEGGGQMVVRSVPLKQANADELANAVTQILSPLGSRGKAPPVKVTPVSSARTMLVKGPEEEVQRVVAMIEQLDATSGAAGQVTQVYQLKYADAREVVTVLESTLGAAGGSGRSYYYSYRYRGGGGGTSEEVRVTAAAGLNSVVVQATPEKQKQAEQLIALLDVEQAGQAGAIQTVRLERAAADGVAQAVNQALQPADRNGSPPSVRVTAVAVAKSVLVTGPPAEVTKVVELIKGLDVTSGETGVETRVYRLEHAEARQVADVLENTMGGGANSLPYYIYSPYRRGGGGTTEAEFKVTAASALNAVVIQASPTQHEQAASLIKALDVEQSAEAGLVRAIQLEKADANSVAMAVNETLSPRDWRSGSPTVWATAVSGTKTVLVNGPPAEVEKVVQLVRELDQAGGDAGMETKVYVLKHASAAQVVEVLQTTLGQTTSSPRSYSYYSYGYRRSELSEFKVTAASGVNAVIVQATPFKQTAAADLIAELDTPELAGAAQVRTVVLRKAEPEAVAQAVNESLAPEGRNGQAPAVRATPVLGTRSVLVRGPAAEVERVLALIAQLDDTGSGGGTETRVYQLKNGDATDLSRTLQQLLSGMARAQSRWASRYSSSNFTVAADERTNAIIVSGTPDAFSVVEQLLPMLDHLPERQDRQIQFYWLSVADAFDVADRLDTVFSDRPEKEQPIIEPDIFSNSLTVVANAADLVVIEDVIRRLDVGAPETTLQVRLITLGSVPADKMTAMLTNIYPQMSPTKIRVMDRLPTPVITPSTNRTGAPVTGSTNQQSSLSPPPAGGNVPSSTNRPAGVAVAGDTNTLAMRSLPGVPPVTASPATPSSILLSGAADSTGSTNALGAVAAVLAQRPDVFLSYDTEANAIIMSGPPLELDQIQDIIDSLSGAFGDTDTEIRQFPLKEADPVAVAKVLTELFKVPQPPQAQGDRQPPQTENGRPVPDRGEGEERERNREGQGGNRNNPPGGNRGGGQPPQQPRVAVVAEPRTRSVIVRASGADMPLMESVIKQLDAPGVSSQLEHRSIPLDYARPDKLLPLIQQMVDQLKEVQPADPVAVGADLRQRAIFAVGRGPVIERLVALIKELDAPSEFAEIELRVFPLKNANAATLATLLRDMLQPAAGTARELSEDAKTLLEQVQRLKLTDDSGQPVTLDLTKPVKIIADPAQANASTGVAQRLILGSTPANLAALAGVVELLDTVPIVEGLTARIIRLKYVDANVVLETLNSIFQQGTGDAGSRRLRGNRGGSSGQSQPATAGSALSRTPNIALDSRNNALILSGLPESIALAEAIIQDLDREMDAMVTEVRLFKLEHALPSGLVTPLRSVFAEGTGRGGGGGARGLSEQISRLRLVMGGEVAQLSDNATARAAVTIQADDPSSTLIVAARSDLMPLIAEVIQTLDVPPAGSFDTLRVFALEHADAASVERVLTDLVRNRSRTGSVRPEDVPTLSVDERTNSLIASGSDAALSLLERLVEELDRELPADLQNVKLIPLENADAGTVATSLQRLMDERNGVTRRGGGGGRSVSTSSLQRVVIIPDERTNTLLVGAAPEGFALVEALAKQLDQAGPSLTGQVRLIPLEHATAQTLATTLTTLFNQRYQAARSPEMQRNRPVILPDPRSNSLLVAAGVEDNRAIDDLLLKLDRQPDNPALELTVIGLTVNDAARVAQTLRGVFAARLTSLTPPGQTPAPAERVDVQADSLSNALIITASKENLVLVESLVAKLDVEPVASEGVIQTFTLKHADVQRVATMLRSLIDQGVYRPGVSTGGGRGGANAAREALAVTADAGSNTLIVSASPENLVVVKELINRLDTPEFTEVGDIRTFPLKHARASYLATVLEQFFRAKRQGETTAQGGQRSVPVTVTADDRSNTLLITGGKESFAAVERMIEQLDTEDAVAKTNFRVFPLKQATAGKLAVTLQRLFTGRPARAGVAPEPVSVIADTWANALIIGAADDDMAMIESLLERLDSATDEAGLQVQVFPLAKADARRVGQTLESLLRGAAVGAPGAAATVAVNVDERLNAVIVSAGEADLKRVGDLVKQLDTDQVARIAEIRVFPLQNARASALATILNDVLNTNPQPLGEENPNRQSLLQFISRRDGGEDLIASALKEGVLIVPDTRINALVVSAPVDYMGLLDEVVKYLDTSSPQIAQIKVFNLRNADARQMALVLTSLFRLEQTGTADANDRSVQYTLVRPAEVGGTGENPGVGAVVNSAEEHALTVTVDLRTNSLLVGGTEHYVALASQIIETLDSSPAQERQTAVYRLRNTRARDVEVPLRTFLQQDIDRITTVLGPNAVGTAQNLLEREVSIVAETNSNTLLISASPRYFNEVEALIEELDQPQAQVLIQVLLAEVQLDSTTELGVEWSYAGSGNPTFNTGTDFAIQEALQNFGGYYAALSGSDVQVLLRALQVDGRLEILSRPQILTADNMEATINIGQRVPLVTGTQVTPQGGTINQFNYEDVGVQLTVTPRVSPDGFVRLDVGPTISALSSSSVQISAGLEVPIINQRTATTTVAVRSGESVLIGGLIGSTEDTRTRKVPFLGDIPLLGNLFRSKKASQGRNELLIVLTPQILTKGTGTGTSVDAVSYSNREILNSDLLVQPERDPIQARILRELHPDYRAGQLTNQTLIVNTNSMSTRPRLQPVTRTTNSVSSMPGR